MIELNVGQLVIDNGMSLFELMLQLQEHTEVILYVFSSNEAECYDRPRADVTQFLCLYDPLLRLRPDGLELVSRLSNCFAFRDMEGNRYEFYGKERAEKFYGKEIDIEEEAKEEEEEDVPNPEAIVPVDGQKEPTPVASEDEVLTIHTPHEIPSYVKIVRIISMDGENVVEIQVPDKPSYEITRHRIF